MEPDSKIYVAGHTGLVGSAIVELLEKRGYTNLILKTRKELDLTEEAAVKQFFIENKPDYVFLAAAKVGGIVANNSLPAEFIYQNIAIQSNVIDNAYKTGVKRLLFLGSSCIYPRECPQPIKEEYLLTGILEPTNRPYAVAKIAGIEMCWSYNRQYSTRYLAAMPTNLYGPHDSYDLKHSHVVPALIRKTYEARQNHQDQLTIWGTGSPKRELLYIDDLADACLFLMNLPDDVYENLISSQDTAPLINIGYSSDITIRDLALLISKIMGYGGRHVFDSSYPDGTPSKLLDSGKIRALGWEPRISLDNGLRMTIEAYQEMVGDSPDN